MNAKSTAATDTDTDTGALREPDYTKCWVWRFADGLSERELLSLVEFALQNWERIPVEMILHPRSHPHPHPHPHPRPRPRSPQLQAQAPTRSRCLLGELSEKLPKDITMWKGTTGRASVLIQRVLDALGHAHTRERRFSGPSLTALRDQSRSGGIPPLPLLPPSPLKLSPSSKAKTETETLASPSAEPELEPELKPIQGLRLELDIPKMRAIQRELERKIRPAAPS